MSDESDAQHRRDPQRRIAVLLGIMFAVLWAVSSGLVSSNDGSHLALSRAIGIRGQASIDPEVALTLWVDRARRAGKNYSDRPPGTAFAAIPVVWLGSRLDAGLFDASVARKDLVIRPATDRFAETYTVRARRLRIPVTPLAAYQGTALLVGLHCAIVGALGLWLLVVSLRDRGVGTQGQAFAALAVGFATLWGPYSTALFSHVTAGTALLGLVWALHRCSQTQRVRVRGILAVIGGVAGSWAVSADYALVVVVVPTVLWGTSWRNWGWVCGGSLAMVGATAVYHDAAFGSPWSIGYDFQTNFAFARGRAETFGGDPLYGLWVLWGLGRGAGVIAQAPIVLVAVGGWMLVRERRQLLTLVAWLILLCFHQTPWGGATEDHRYLVPAMPLLGLGLGFVWQQTTALAPRSRRAVQAALVLLALASAGLVWIHFLQWRG